ncbi:asparagine synthase-related protein [Ascidiimonas sp. W6]|uniref:asparagine synthase-related protein n=1 Tax=Ascidiimonas meishanensis TaxID=3128903 RepID=UPI0030EF7A57
MKQIRTDIIPVRQEFVYKSGDADLDWEAICFFVAVGFFPGTDTYYKYRQVLPPGSESIITKNGYVHESNPWFQWYYKPRDISFSRALEEFTQLFESIVEEQSKGMKVILPLSGGLDSRTQAVALKRLNATVHAYSYSFKGGYPEHKISAKIAKASKFPFTAMTIPSGYLWNEIDNLAKMNQCYADFTHPRQLAVIDELKSLGNVFSLGHWGDVLFDNENLPPMSHDEQVHLLIKKIIKKGGAELAEAIWKAKELNGSFAQFLEAKVSAMLATIRIEEPNARIRAFKSKYWAPRWTSVNLSVFESVNPVKLPYYDARMCNFICTIPEAYLADRKLQKEYIKRKAPQLARITWQESKPFNLYNAHLNREPYNLPYRAVHKLKRELNGVFGKKFVQRNWELQFLGGQQQTQLKTYLNSVEMRDFIPSEITQQILTNFNEKDSVYWSHPLSMLLTLAVFAKKFRV